MTVETVADVPEGLTLVTGAHETQEILELAGVSDQVDRRGSVFVGTSQGEYSDIYWFPGCVPYLSKPVRKLV